MSAFGRDQVYSDLEVDPRHFAEGQPRIHPQISRTGDPREEKIVQHEHRLELHPDGDILNQDGPWKSQTQKRRCGLSRRNSG